MWAKFICEYVTSFHCGCMHANRHNALTGFMLDGIYFETVNSKSLVHEGLYCYVLYQHVVKMQWPIIEQNSIQTTDWRRVLLLKVWKLYRSGLFNTVCGFCYYVTPMRAMRTRTDSNTRQFSYIIVRCVYITFLLLVRHSTINCSCIGALGRQFHVR